MTLSVQSKFLTTSSDYDLLEDATIVNKIKGELGEDAYDNIRKGNGRVTFTVIVDSPTQIKFRDNGIYHDFLKDIVYAPQGMTFVSKIIIKDTGISGFLSLAIQ